ncbi:class I SAM-dependent methyltransferase [Candidatus Margulisiibacteriota bacterium]
MLQEMEKVRKFFAHQLNVHGKNSPSAVHWNSKETQLIRFYVLAMIDVLSEHSVLDLGCGVGDMYKFFKDEDINVHYTGWDITPEMIQAATKKYPEAEFDVKNILMEKTLPFYDYVLASGTMNIKISGHEEWLFAMVRKMFEIANMGVGFNLLNKQGNADNRTFFATEPEKIEALCKKITSNVVLRQDYLPNDFTIYMYK